MSDKLTGPVLELLNAGAIEIKKVNGEIVIRVTDEGKKILFQENLVDVEYDESLKATVTATPKGEAMIEVLEKELKGGNQ
jgi:predicted transcriptional regulator